MDYSDQFLSPDSVESSGHHTRSRSFKGRPRPKEHEEHGFRPRRNSMPSHPRRGASPSPVMISNEEEEEGEKDSTLCRVRSFKTTSKGGIVNRGDSVKRKAQRDQLRMHSTNSGHTDNEEGYDPGVRHASFADVQYTCQKDENQTEAFTVVVLGPAGVGKTLLTTQFMTSEYIGTSSDGDGESRNVKQ